MSGISLLGIQLSQRKHYGPCLSFLHSCHLYFIHQLNSQVLYAPAGPEDGTCEPCRSRALRGQRGEWASKLPSGERPPSGEGSEQHSRRSQRSRRREGVNTCGVAGRTMPGRWAGSPGRIPTSNTHRPELLGRPPPASTRPGCTAGPATSPGTFLGNDWPSNTTVVNSVEQRGAIQSSRGH